MPGIAFGDRVRVRSTPLTEQLGLSGALGQVFGLTIPSKSDVDQIIGDSKQDYAINVFFEDRKEQFWFREDLLEFTDHGAGTEITLRGIEKKWTRSETGEWTEQKISTAPAPWWKNWLRIFTER